MVVQIKIKTLMPPWSRGGLGLWSFCDHLYKKIKRLPNFLQKAPFLTFCMRDFKGPCDQCRIATLASPPLPCRVLILINSNELLWKVDRKRYFAFGRVLNFYLYIGETNVYSYGFVIYQVKILKSNRFGSLSDSSI
jgi:hypothetical protein